MFWKRSPTVLVSNDQRVPEVVDSSTGARAMVAQDIIVVLEALRGEGAHTAMAYAHMQGFLDKTIGSTNINDFMRHVESEPNFTTSGAEFAVSHALNEAEAALTGEWSEMQLYGQNFERNMESRAIFDAVRAEARRIGLTALAERVEFNTRNYLIERSIIHRNYDIKFIRYTFELKKPFLKPLLLRAKANGRDKYGEIDYSTFHAEINEFVRKFIAPGLRFYSIYVPMALIYSIVEGWLGDQPQAFDMPSSGIDFEHWCADRIAEQGWAVTVSKASGDQGVDVLATKSDFTVAIQCKRYSSAVGNKAVQEVFAGMRHYRANAAMVIATSGFTKSAIELSENTGVIILDAENIGNFSEQCERFARE